MGEVLLSVLTRQELLQVILGLYLWLFCGWRSSAIVRTVELFQLYLGKGTCTFR